VLVFRCELQVRYWDESCKSFVAVRTNGTSQQFDKQIAPNIILIITNTAQIWSGIAECITYILRVLSLSKTEVVARHLGVEFGHWEFSSEYSNLREVCVSYRPRSEPRE
jgi:hypothetical protein